jgi:hypothetical protein
LAPIACLTGVGCAHGTRPDDMTAEQHQAAAQKEQKKAQQEEATAYTNAPGANALNAGIEPELYLYPQAGVPQDHLADARRLQEHAREHEQAAAQLQQFEEAECKGLPASQRSTCPLMRSITDVGDIDGGVRIRFVDQSHASTALPRMRCHYAYARAHGFSNSPDCALYIRGVDFRQSSDPHAIDIVSNDPKTTAEIRKRMHASAEQRAR